MKTNGRKPRFFLAYVHPGIITHAFHVSVLNATLQPVYEIAIGEMSSGPYLSESRNDLLRMFLSTDCDYFFSVDTDIRFEPSVPMRLRERGLPIVSAVYYGRDSDFTLFPVGHGLDDERLEPEQVHPQGVIEVSSVGMGCCLIEREVITKLGVDYLWPYAEVLKKDKKGMQSEDVTFCERASELGYKIALDTDVKVDHRKWGFI